MTTFEAWHPFPVRRPCRPHHFCHPYVSIIISRGKSDWIHRTKPSRLLRGVRAQPRRGNPLLLKRDSFRPREMTMIVDSCGLEKQAVSSRGFHVQNYSIVIEHAIMKKTYNSHTFRINEFSIGFVMTWRDKNLVGKVAVHYINHPVGVGYYRCLQRTLYVKRN